MRPILRLRSLAPVPAAAVVVAGAGIIAAQVARYPGSEHEGAAFDIQPGHYRRVLRARHGCHAGGRERRRRRG